MVGARRQMAKTNRDREIIERYQAKQEIARQRAERAPRDNRLFALVAIGAVLVAGLGQVAYFGLTTQNEASLEESVDELVDEIDEEQSSNEVPDPSVAENREWQGTLELNNEPLDITMFGDLAPQAVANFVTLSENGFYEDMDCHRLVTDGIFVLQCGDPNGDGSGGPGYTWGPIENAPEDDLYPAGSIAMARAGNLGDSMGSQFFIVYEDSTIPSDVAGGYTIMGQVDNGLETVRQIAERGTTDGSNDGTPAETVKLNSVDLN
jgi:peptidyl-prolyl cis-trans isomerase B (cyclophilin B)